MTGVLQEGRPRLVLASTSKTRARLLEAAGLSFTTKAPGLDEVVMREAISGEESLDPHDVAEVLARAKAEAVSDGASGAYVIGALSGYGLMSSNAAADLLAAHVTGTPLPPYAAAFSPSRYDDPAYRARLDTWADSGQL